VEERRDRDVLTLARLARVLERACSESTGARLTLAQYRLLAMMADGAERASHLAGQLALTKPTVSATIDTLVERGLVARESVDGDRRATRLRATDAGHAALLVAEVSMRERLDDLLARVDDPGAVSRSIAQVRAALDERRDERRAARADA
jgi:DNA-binding MarR family transcriptional regulator